jgi:hypothetical protein
VEIDRETMSEVHILGCVCCPRVSSAYATRWRAYLVDDPDEEDTPRLDFYCPDCARRVFG